MSTCDVLHSFEQFRAEPEPAVADRYMDKAARAARDALAHARAQIRLGIVRCTMCR